MKEIWKHFRNDYYEVSNKGRVRRAKEGGPRTYVGKILTPATTIDGYKYIQTRVDKVPKNYLMHCLVMRKFVGKCPKGKEVNHKDLDKTNNDVRNLEYKTHKKNLAHARNNGIKLICKLTKKDRHKVIKMFSKGTSIPVLADAYEISKRAVWNIVHKKVA